MKRVGGSTRKDMEERSVQNDTSEIVVKEPGNDRTEVATGAITSEMRQTEHTLWKAERLNLNLQDKE